MNNSEFKNLVKRYLTGQASAKEEEYLFKYYDKLQENEISWDRHEMGLKEEVESKLYSRAFKEIRKRELKNSDVRTMRRWGLAAAILLMVSAVFYLYVERPEQQMVKAVHKKQPVRHDILPGGNKAILTLADGTQIILDNAKDGTLTTQGNISVNKSKDGQLVYKVSNRDLLNSNAKLEYNTIKTPVSGQYQVVLSDDTKVWLNAGSSIRFPTAFSANERLVEIEGEAYFEVSKDKKRPFRVKSDSQLIEVLGTHFNVNAYRDESSVKTTVLEGSVKISAGSENKIIKPGQQNRLSRTKQTMDVVDVDLEEATAWKNGLFMFDNEEIHSIMRKISRWYGVEVVYEDGNIEEKFGGTVSRFENVSQVLKILEVTGTIHFKIVQGDSSGKGRRIVVMK